MIDSKNNYASQILVCGTINIDFISIVERMPMIGETLTALNFTFAPGGKALNQAIATSRMKADTKLVGKIGDDEYGEYLSNIIKREGINAKGILKNKDTSTGNSFVIIDSTGSNSIITNLNVNKTYTAKDLDSLVPHLDNVKISLLQLEMNYDSREFILKTLKDNNIKIVLNLAPVVKISKKSMSYVDVVIVNEIEAEQLIGKKLKSVKDVVSNIRELRVIKKQKIIITLGEQGCVILDGDQVNHIKSPTVVTKNTSGAGDCFCGTFVAKWIDYNFKDAVYYALYAASLSVTKLGSLEAFPNSSELDEFLRIKQRGE